MALLKQLFVLTCAASISFTANASDIYKRKQGHKHHTQHHRVHQPVHLPAHRPPHVRPPHVRPPHHKPGYVVVPRHRHFHTVVIYRPYGHAYHGYGHYHSDNDAFKWLAFTAITLKLLDNLNESAQRRHEAAQVAATTANTGQKITWQDGSSSGYVVATKEGTHNTTGLTCREFQQSITVGGKTEKAYGTACLQPDGAWKIVS
ncbi:RT0821/Lpp0805 family surface protein [Motilimonas pumila]|uniref:Uncharacterized protein n=1 Tax=Motilimonas pumila TaxID=2303987 RepID=A0A418YIK9_9GAMM|nr:RT0821/Lpp0805 family surface protein [Motilimonas pumila]RJG50457.1 hypothetical protein D1Z90_02970 [Motilimonas pumila]